VRPVVPLRRRTTLREGREAFEHVGGAAAADSSVEPRGLTLRAKGLAASIRPMFVGSAIGMDVMILL
jgi:hypothetical protein